METRHIDIEPEPSNPSATLAAILRPISEALNDRLPDLPDEYWMLIADAITDAAIAGVRVGIAESTGALHELGIDVRHELHVTGRDEPEELSE